MAISTLTIPCPIDGLPCFVLDLEWRKNTATDRGSHVHIEIAGQAQCATGHRWLIGDDRSQGGSVPNIITLHRVGG